MNARLKVIADNQGGVFSRAQALASGYTPDQVVACLRAGYWVRLRRGQYAENVDVSHLPPWERARWAHRQRTHAAMNSLRSGSVAASHQSALVLHGLPVWGLDLGLVHVSRVHGRSGGVVAGVQHHLGKLTPNDLTVLEGRLATTAGRAVLEAACTASFEAAVVGVDALLHAGGLNAADLHRLQEVIEFWPGSATARAALRFGDPLSESVGESRMRVFLYEYGFPTPVLQAEFRDRQGFVGRVDFYFPAYGLVIEFDGLLKYGGAAADVLVEEKRREDRLRALGLTVVRSVWSDLDHPATLAAALRRTFAAARRTA
ncbi:type IV toxin-antitoxin system AbiEi family antitoxin domain-containing protein [Kribbella sp. HUAS MG21]|uniref:Type IV toxin-antitoxin system AbiEi family antitoxin domain-containing protein n=1 Tax=Kribbella sp. HUAS MG21 TaxID=3160966 RepID=A0AAU7TC01_9ACTN